MFGEIDCREGIVVSVDKGRYKDLEEGVTATVNIYIKVRRRARSFDLVSHFRSLRIGQDQLGPSFTLGRA